MRILIFDNECNHLYGSFQTTHDLGPDEKAVIEFESRIAETFNYRTEKLPPKEIVYVIPPYPKSEREQKINALCNIISTAKDLLPPLEASITIEAAQADLLALIEGR